MIIEPKKRLSKYGENTASSSKYGTYLQYKKISKYENKNKMEQRIIAFLRLRNYDEHLVILCNSYESLPILGIRKKS